MTDSAYHPLIEVAESWPVSSQIKIAQEWDNTAMRARNAGLNHSNARRLAFEARAQARQCLRAQQHDTEEETNEY